MKRASATRKIKVAHFLGTMNFAKGTKILAFLTLSDRAFITAPVEVSSRSEKTGRGHGVDCRNALSGFWLNSWIINEFCLMGKSAGPGQDPSLGIRVPSTKKARGVVFFDTLRLRLSGCHFADSSRRLSIHVTVAEPVKPRTQGLPPLGSVTAGHRLGVSHWPCFVAGSEFRLLSGLWILTSFWPFGRFQ